MSLPGTIDLPLAHRPHEAGTDDAPHVPRAAGSALPARTTSGAITSRQNRNLEMQLIPEVLARAHMHEGRARPARGGPARAAPRRAGLAARPTGIGHGRDAALGIPPNATW
ncbi:hypothetical protein GCM10020221_26280 [Streptomyces thioluteus]|uniref:Uncharacterized protein n=1 Tax=Streptomyces thioluteus TaxID=66431 RepID=A0ABN3WXM0_STRTU